MLQCNINAKGKAIRLVYGIVLFLTGVILAIAWARPTGGWIAWTIVTALVLGGAFAVFEARAGWCVIRAMGFRTRF